MIFDPVTMEHIWAFVYFLGRRGDAFRIYIQYRAQNGTE